MMASLTCLKNRLEARIFIGLICFLPWVGCQKPSQVEGIKIGEVGSMTGVDATFGTSTHRGIALAIQEANQAGGVKGRKIELISRDDLGQASDAAMAITQLITQNHVQAVLGEVASGRSLAMAPIAMQYKIPMISPSSLHEKVTQQGNMIFRVCFIDRDQAKVMADFAIQHLHAKRVAILRDFKSDYSQDSARLFIDFFKLQGGVVVANQSYTSGDIDFKSQLTAIRTLHPDVIVVPGYYTEVGLIARQVRELGMKIPLLGGDGWDSPKLKEIGGEAIDGSYFVSHFAADDATSQVVQFVNHYQKAYGMGVPDGLAALGYDAARVLIDALKRAASDSSTDLQSALSATQHFPGVTGEITINAKRNAIKPAVVFKMVSGQPKIALKISTAQVD